MSSRAKGYRSRKRRRSYGQANKERRARALEVYRPVVKEDSERVAAALDILFDVEHDDFTWPSVTSIPSKHRLTILSPLYVKQKYANGFEAGYTYRGAMDDIQARFDGVPETSVDIGGVSLIGFAGRKNMVALNVSGERTAEEQREAKRALSESGVRGIPPKELKKSVLSRIIVARLDTHVPTLAEIDHNPRRYLNDDVPVIDAEGLAIQVETHLAAHDLTTLHLGQVVVHSVKS